MAAHIAVVDPLPMFQQGVAGVLAAVGHTVDAPAEVSTWVPSAGCRAVVLTLCSERDWERLAWLRARHPTVDVIALIDEDSVAAGVRAVQAGARSVLPRRVSAESLTRTVAASADGQALLPAAVMAALAAGAPAGRRGENPLSAQQLSWLRRLAAGVTVARLAADVGYSERAMYRLLRSVYRTIGTRGRVQAILLAQQRGWLAADE